jgi:hypothetical protein
MDDAIRVDTRRVLVCSVDIDNDGMIMVEPVRTRVDTESERRVLP